MLIVRLVIVLALIRMMEVESDSIPSMSGWKPWMLHLQRSVLLRLLGLGSDKEMQAKKTKDFYGG